MTSLNDAQPILPTLADAFWPAQEGRRALRALALAVAGTALLTLSAKIQVPFWPVPMTLQTLVVLVLGMALGWRLGAATVLLYLAEGAAGLPVFAGTPEKGIGLAYMTGPTGGYLVGFVAAAALCGWLAERSWDRDWLRTAAAMLLGHAAIFAFGVTWLAILLDWSRAVQFGLAPFYAATAVKTALAVLLLPFAWRFVGKGR